MSAGTLAWPLEHAARFYPDALAVVDGERRLTYGELHRRVGSLGRSLPGLGLERGDFVGMLAQNSLPHLESWLGVPAFGYVLNDLNFRLAVAELVFMIEDCGTRVLCVDETHLEAARECRERCGCLEQLVYLGDGECPDDCVSWESLVSGEPAAPPELPEDTLAALSYTGGTTGRPKGVMLSHGNLLANAKHNTSELGYRSEDRYLHVAPMFHVADTSQTFCLTWAGGLHVIHRRFDAAQVLDAIAEHRLTLLVLVPTMIRLFLAELAARPVDVSSVRRILYAASPISPELQRQAMDALPGCEFWQGYGMTEAAPSITFLTDDDHRRGDRLLSVGRTLRGVQAEVRDLQGGRLAPGEIGEIWARGPNIMLGYWNRPEATEAALVDGWYLTGDAGYQDEDGYFFLVDRLKDMIVTGGENVYSIEVERALTEHEDVDEVAVFAIPNALWGESVHAVVVARAGSRLVEEDLIAHCRERIAGYKVPRSIEIREEPLPKSGAGKILKHELREPFWVDLSRRVG